MEHLLLEDLKQNGILLIQISHLNFELYILNILMNNKTKAD